MTNDNHTVASVLEQLEGALRASDSTGAAQLFEENGFWRDLVLFTWNLKTMEGRAQIADMLSAQLGAVQPVTLCIADGEQASEAGGVMQCWITVETRVGRGTGFIRIRDGKIWTLLTTMGELKGHEEPRGGRRPMGAEHGARTKRSSWLEHREQEARELGYARQPYCVIIGGGQGGIALGARLRQLNVPTIIIEKNARPGDSWRKRYKSLCLHDPVWYDHMPYIDFPKNWPVFSPKDKIGDWLEMYTKVMELNYWTNTACESASF